MRGVLEVFRTRLIPAALTAAGVALVTAGLLSYTTPVDEPPGDLSSPVIITESTPSPAPSSIASGSVQPSASSTPAPTFPRGRVATRITIPGLKIDLPIVKPPGGANTYPLCDVAMYIQQLGQPGQGRATYIYAHAREGMFLPLLDASKVNNGQSMLGMLAYVYTSDDQLFVYEIYQVRRHQLDLNRAIKAKTEQLWLQTSEGPRGTPQKLQVVARPVTNGPVSHAQAHPKPHPVVCG
jgi:sortase (surface protein transpeptidase)